MVEQSTTLHEKYPDAHHDTHSKTVFGFWIYLVTDFMLFATLFAAYAVLRNNTFGGPGAKDLFNLPYTAIQSFVLLLSAFTASIASIHVHRKNKHETVIWFFVTLALGILFTVMEFREFHNLVMEGFGWQRSAFLSAFFTVVGTHLIHVLFALLWTVLFLIQVFMDGITQVTARRLICLKMFWQFLNVVWIFIFAIVYLIGAN